MNLRIAIVDDEPPARRLLREILEALPAVEVVAEFATGREAIAGLRGLQADGVFLDIRLPDVDGFRVLRELDAGLAAAVVFITAHDDFAVRAFDVSAVDYVLKPFDDERVERALTRLRRRKDQERTPDRQELLQLLQQLTAERRYLTRLPIPGQAGRVVLMRVGDIRWLEASGKHTLVHAGGEPRQVRDTLAAVAAVLDPSRFVRVSRFAVVNLDRVKEIQPWFHGELMIVLEGDVKVRATRGYKHSLERLLKRDPSFADKA